MSNWPKVLVMDLDGTIVGGEYNRPYPKGDVIEKVNQHYDAGWDVIIFTARGMNTFQGDAQKCDETYRKLTEETLRKFGVKYTRLQFGKPAGVMYVDDRAVRPDEFANSKL